MSFFRVLTLLLLLFLSFCVGCDGGTRIEGRIRDGGNANLSDVSVTLTVGGRSQSIRTDADGHYRISMMHSPFNVEETIRFQKSGYVAHEVHFMSHDRMRELDVTLLADSNTKSSN